MKREGRFREVENQLAPSRVTQAGADDKPAVRPPLPAGRVVDEEPEPVHHLRAYSNYMTPRPGRMSVDSWTVGVVVVRNVLINQLFLLPLAMLLVLLGRLVVRFYGLPAAGEIDGLRDLGFWAFAGLFLWTMCALGVNVIWLERREVVPGGRPLWQLT